MSIQTRITPAGLLSFRFGRAYVITMRPYLLFVSGIAGIVGLALAPAVDIPPTVLLAAVFFLSYGFGQALTDCFQLDTDSLSAPYRPLVRGMVRRRDVLAVSLAGLAAGGAILVRSHPVNASLALLAIGGLASYTFFKRRWWAGPFYNAWIVALLPVMGFVSASGVAASPLVWPASLTWAVLAAFFGYANFVLAGYFKDISADRETGYNTFPVVFGMGAAAWVSDGFAVLALAAAALGVVAAFPGGGLEVHHWIALAFLAAGAWATLLAQFKLHGVTDEAQAHEAIAPVVHAFLLILSAIAVAHRAAWAVPLVLFYLGFLWVLKHRPMREQI
jgi:4-hydroxybenzoate polyprenyltransferase